MNAPENLLTDDHLRAQVKLLGTLLGQVLLQFAGEDVFEAVETLRRGFAELHQQEDQQRRTELMGMIDAMPATKVELVVRAFSSYFMLVNVAEESFSHRNRRRPVAADVPQRAARGWVMRAVYAKIVGFDALKPALPGAPLP